MGRGAAAPAFSTAAAEAGAAATSSATDIAGTLELGEHADVRINGRIESGSGGSLSVGDGSTVHINGRIESGSGGSLSVGDGSTVHINGRIESGSGGSLSVGDGSTVHINGRIESGSGGSLSVSDGSTVQVNGRLDAEAHGAAAFPANVTSGVIDVPARGSIQIPRAVYRPFSASAYEEVGAPRAETDSAVSTPSDDSNAASAPLELPRSTGTPANSASGLHLPVQHGGAARPSAVHAEDPRVGVMRQLIRKITEEAERAKKKTEASAAAVRQTRQDHESARTSQRSAASEVDVSRPRARAMTVTS